MLLGEYAVLEGHPALLAAVDRYAYAEPGRSDASTPGVCSWLAEEPNPQLAGVSLLSKKLALQGWYTVDTSAFLNPQGVKLGLGSSAAALTSLMALARPNLSIKERCLMVLGTNYEAQGSVGSGADVAASSFGGLLTYRRTPLTCARLVPDRAGVAVLFFETEQAASTVNLVRQVSAHRKQPSVDRIFGAMSEATQAAHSALRSKDRARLITWFAQYGRLVKALGEETGAALWLKAHSDAEEIAKSLGGCAKPTGAGGGDLLLVAVPKENAEAARSKLAQAGMRWVDLKISVQGATPHGDKDPEKRLFYL